MNSWQIGPDNEPSIGTPHHLVYESRATTMLVDTSTNTAGVWSAAVFVDTRIGAKAAWCNIYGHATSQMAIICVEAATGYTLDAVTGTGYRQYIHIKNATAVGAGSMVRIPLDVDRYFKWCTFTTNTTVQIAPSVDYDM